MTDWIIPQTVLGWNSPLAWGLFSLEIVFVIILVYLIERKPKDVKDKMKGGEKDGNSRKTEEGI